MSPTPEDLLDALGRVPIPAESAEQAATRRERVLQGLELVEQDLATRARVRGKRTRVAGVGVAFACGVAATLGLPRLKAMMEPARDVPLALVSGQIETGPQGLRPANTGFQVSVGQRLRATSAHARLDVDRDATLDLAGATELSFAGLAGRRVVELHRGSVHLNVDRLGEGRTLSVRTSDATVTVHGTSFSVTAAEADARVCTVVVLEQGVVSVDSGGRHALLTAPSRWSSCPAPQKPTGAVPTATRAPQESATPDRPAPVASEMKPVPAPALRAPAAASHATSGPASIAPRSSTLAEENLLLALARKAALGSRDVEAVSHLERLLQRYPHSILAQNASVERFRALARLGRLADASKAAARYLSAYPDGFARDEARALVGRVP